jgi:hypothetical protein
MKAWKSSDEVNKVHDDLYNPNDPSDKASETYLMLIIKSVFNNEEVTTENVVWTQSVLESIFDVDHLSSKIDGDIIETWTKIIKNEGQVISVVNRVAFLFFLLFNILLLLRVKMMKRVKTMKRMKRR